MQAPTQAPALCVPSLHPLCILSVPSIPSTFLLMAVVVGLAMVPALSAHVTLDKLVAPLQQLCDVEAPVCISQGAHGDGARGHGSGCALRWVPRSHLTHQQFGEHMFPTWELNA